MPSFEQCMQNSSMGFHSDVCKIDMFFLHNIQGYFNKVPVSECCLYFCR